MSKENVKILNNVEVSLECWKRLKIISIQKEVSISVVVKDILEKVTSGKKFKEEEALEV